MHSKLKKCETVLHYPVIRRVNNAIEDILFIQSSYALIRDFDLFFPQIDGFHQHVNIFVAIQFTPWYEQFERLQSFHLLH